MLSRIADSMYWMARSLERVDNTARLLDINLLYLLEAEDALAEPAQWQPLLGIFRSEDNYAEIHGDADIRRDRVIRFMTQEKKNPGSLYSSLRVARENARVVRDRISFEMWEAMNEFWLEVDRHLKRPLRAEKAPEFFGYVRNQVARFHGLTMNTMMRGEPFSFYMLGNFLERADMTSRTLDVKYHMLLPDASMIGSPVDYYQWGALLKSLSAFDAFRRQYHAGLRPIDVVEFVILEPEFPRSLRFAVGRMEQAVQRIGTNRVECEICQAMVALKEQLEEHTARSIFDYGLHEYLTDFLEHIDAFNNALQSDYFEAYLAADVECAT
ncbi:MAG: alpha-E domain-containing protein [Gammaproteobacteria bacterium]|nr:alpha-E domain-containing protein [Gammaproteobacteria bacterium]